MSRVLRTGSSGPDVAALQGLLNRRLPALLPPLREDGYFGAQTAARLREFQRLTGLTTDGIAGPETWAKLNATDLALKGDVTGPRPQPTGQEERAWERDHPEGLVEELIEDDNNRLFFFSNFAVGSAELKREHFLALKDLAKRLKKVTPTAVLDITGHTSGSGVKTFNKQISTARAVAVANALRQLGVAQSLLTDGLGSGHPRVPNTTPENMALNRRVELRQARLV